MGLFDNIRCEYPLPDGSDAHEFQTKDTPSQCLDTYTIRSDGTLWRTAYDTEDRCDPNAEGLDRFFGCMTRVRSREVPCRDYCGSIEFYEGQSGYVALFDEGRLLKIRAQRGKSNG